MNLVSFIFSTIIVLLVYFFLNIPFNKISLELVPIKNGGLENIDEIEINTNNVDTDVINNVQISEEWFVEIPRIELKADIVNGTDAEILNTYIGHFEETAKWDGNSALAAHNRGYNVNYFEKIKELETGDEIYYTYNGSTRKYIVKYRDIIKETDWSYLEETEDNRLTLITCVEDLPEYRRCIQAIEYKEEE